MTNLPDDPSWYDDEEREREIYAEAMAQLHALQSPTCTAVRQIVGRAWQTLWDEGVFGRERPLDGASAAFDYFLRDVFESGNPPIGLAPEGFTDLGDPGPGEIVVYADSKEIVILQSEWADHALRSDSQWRIQSLEEYRAEFNDDQAAA